MYRNIIYTVNDTENGIQAYVNERLAGDYSVSIYDTDAEKFLPTMRIFKDREEAIDFARKCTNSKGE